MNSQELYARSNDPSLYQKGANQNLRGMDTQFMNTNLYNDNKDLYSKSTLQRYNVIENNGLQSTIINKPYKLVLYKDVDGTGIMQSWTFNEAIKDVVSVKLLTGQITGSTSSNAMGYDFISLDIDELNKTRSDGTTNFENSFAIFDFDALRNTTNIFKNNFYPNNDIKYFDPPLNSLNKLTFRAYGDGDTELDGSSGLTFKIKLEILIETKEKLKIY